MGTSEDIKVLSERVASGIANEQDMGLALRTLGIGLSCSLLSTLERVNVDLGSLDELVQRVIVRYEESLRASIDADALGLEELQRHLEFLQGQRLKFLELQRKVIQSPVGLFPQDSLSSDERRLLEFFQSFSSQEEKRRFIDAVSKVMQTSEF